MSFSNILIQWYLQNKRELPWRGTRNPYHIWLSEIILQQTRVDQGLQYYKNFVEKYPTVQHLAKADEDEVLKLWQGLGYYSRARNLLFSARHIVNELKGEFPATYEALLDLKGVGDYTASAISSICYKSPQAVVDGNVYRVLSRVFGINTPINSSQGVSEFKTLAQELIDQEKPGTHNQAIMEFGAVHCKPKNPKCHSCPFGDICTGIQTKTVASLPVKTKQASIKKRYFNYLVIDDILGQSSILKRKGKGIWQGLYEFPLIESSKELSLKQLLDKKEFSRMFEKNQFSISLFNEKPMVHKLSHQHLYTNFWIIHTELEITEGILWTEIKKYPVPTLIQNFVEEYKPMIFLEA